MNIDQFLVLKKEYEAAIAQNGRAMFKEIFYKFFDETPEISKISWTQYTPYFCDGDPCVFGVNDFYFCPTGKENEFDDEFYDFTNYYFKKDKELKQKLDAFCANILKLGDDVFQNIFGDHARVTASYDENGEVVFVVESYEHE